MEWVGRIFCSSLETSDVLSFSAGSGLSFWVGFQHGYAMPSEPIVATATVTEERDERTVYLALPNGKVTLGHLAKAGLSLRPQLVPGTRVEVEMTSFDFEKARVVRILEPGDRAS